MASTALVAVSFATSAVLVVASFVVAATSVVACLVVSAALSLFPHPLNVNIATVATDKTIILFIKSP